MMSQDLFIDSIWKFRNLMLSKVPLETKDAAFRGLCQDYIRCDLTQEYINFFIITSDEWSRRRLYEALIEVKHG